MDESGGLSNIWRRAIKGTVIAELAGIWIADHAIHSEDAIADSVCAAINELPWFYRRPLKTLAFGSAAISIVTGMANLDEVSEPTRLRVLRALNWMPGFRLFRKYVRALALLALFDAPGVVHPSLLGTTVE